MAENDSFDDAFAALAAAMDVTTAEGAARTPEQAVAAVQEAGAKTPEEVAAEAKAAEDAAAAATKAAEDAAAAAKTPEEIAAEAKVAEEAASRATADAKAQADAQAKAEADARAAAEAAKAETPEQKKQREEFETSITPYELTEAEVAAEAQSRKDFPTEWAAIDANAKRQERTFNARVYQAVQNLLQHVDGRIAPVERATTDISYDRHMAALHAAHPDYDTVVTSLPQWIKTQPALFQPALQAAYDKGSTQDVIDLVAAYKKDVPAAPTDGTPPPVVKPKPNDAADLAPVTQRRTTPNPKGTKDPNDYSGAFDEAAELYATK